MVGLTIYFSYGVTHSNAAKESRNSLFESQSSTMSQSMPEKKNTAGMRNECLLLSKKQNGLQSKDNGDTCNDRELNEDRNYHQSADRPNSIIRNYNPRQARPNNLFSSVSQDISLDEPSPFSLEPYI